MFWPILSIYKYHNIQMFLTNLETEYEAAAGAQQVERQQVADT